MEKSCYKKSDFIKRMFFDGAIFMVVCFVMAFFSEIVYVPVCVSICIILEMFIGCRIKG